MTHGYYSEPEAKASPEKRDSSRSHTLASRSLQPTLGRNKEAHRLSLTSVFLVLLTFVLWFLAFKVTANNQVHQDSFISNARIAVMTITAFFIIVAMLFLPDGLIARPSQLLWKAVTGFSMLYLMCLVFFVFLTKEQTQNLLGTFFDSSLGKPLKETSYAADCRLHTPENPESNFKNLKDSFFDIFVVAHLIGWFFKTLICRDLKLVIFQSVFFEFLELTFRHLLPNFYECWWDHVFLDVLGMNLLGILAGWFVIKRYNLERLKWSLRDGPLKKSFFANVREFLTNADVSNVEYKCLTSTKKYIQVAWFVLFMPLVDLTFFFNKFILRMPPSQYINVLRTLLMGFLSINASKEYYMFITRREKEMRINAFMSHAILLTELLLFCKNYNGQFTNPYPLHAKIVIALVLSVFFGLLGKVLASDLTRWYRSVKKSKNE